MNPFINSIENSDEKTNVNEIDDIEISSQPDLIFDRDSSNNSSLISFPQKKVTLVNILILEREQYRRKRIFELPII